MSTISLAGLHCCHGTGHLHSAKVATHRCASRHNDSHPVIRSAGEDTRAPIPDAKAAGGVGVQAHAGAQDNDVADALLPAAQ